jgi:hypothetical protein
MQSGFVLLVGLMATLPLFAQRISDPTKIPDPGITRSPASVPESREVVEVKGDWVIRTNQTASNTLFRVHGNIYLLPDVTWELTDCEVIIMCQHARQYRMYWQKGSVLKTTRCKLGGFDDGTRFAPANFEAGGGTWIGTDTEVHTCYAVSVGDGSVLRGERFMAGKNPDSIIISGGAQVFLKDSRFPLSISMHCKNGGEVELDLPCGKPMTQVMDASQFLNGAAQYKVTFENTIVPHWFIFVRDISSATNYPPASVTIRRCENFLLSLLSKDVNGEIQLPVNLEHPIRMGNATVQRAVAATVQEVSMRMYGGVYFSGKPDAVIRGPETLPGGKPVHLAETMIWGGKLQIDGGASKTILLNCTTMDVWGGELAVENLKLGNPASRNGQIIVEKTGKFTARNCDFGKGVLVLTKDEGAAEFFDCQGGERVRIQSKGGNVDFIRTPAQNAGQ